jgi:hypothetical protein
VRIQVRQLEGEGGCVLEGDMLIGAEERDAAAAATPSLMAALLSPPVCPVYRLQLEEAEARMLAERSEQEAVKDELLRLREQASS